MKNLIYIFLFVCSSLTAQNGAVSSASLQLSIYQQGNSTPTGTELLTELNAAAKESEGNSDGSWDPNYYAAPETTDVHVGTYSYKISRGSGTYRRQNLDFVGTIGDQITFSFWAKCNTANDQKIKISGTSDDSDFWTLGNQPLAWTFYTRTVTLTSTNFYIRIIAADSAGVDGDYLLIDNLSLLKLN